MAGKIRSLLGKIGSTIGRILGKRPKQAQVRPSVLRGSRGIAAGSLKERQRRQEAGEQPFTAEEIAKWREIGGDEAAGFLDGHQPLFVHSTNVSMLQYYPETSKLMVEYRGGAAYLYENVSRDEAQQFLTAPSKGGACWDLLRVRGSRTAHKKPYKRVR